MDRLSGCAGPWCPGRVTSIAASLRALDFYSIRAVKLETSPAGTYLNPSQALFSAAVTAGEATGPEIHLVGNAQPIALADTVPLAANATEFGGVEVTAEFTHAYTLSNVGAATLQFTGAALTGANPDDFSLIGTLPAALDPGAVATLAIRFRPTASGGRTAVITIESNDEDEPSCSFAVGGTGLPPHAEIAIDPPEIRRTIHPGDAVTETLEISNPGPGTLVHVVASSLDRYRARDSDSFAGPAYQWIELWGSKTPRSPGGQTSTTPPAGHFLSGSTSLFMAGPSLR